MLFRTSTLRQEDVSVDPNLILDMKPLSVGCSVDPRGNADFTSSKNWVEIGVDGKAKLLSGDGAGECLARVEPHRYQLTKALQGYCFGRGGSRALPIGY